ncbi:MAG: hypothetical protein JWM44_2004 [Bacilli bacterium]|nr:hypothetical protein [Bacilli bacterium]
MTSRMNSTRMTAVEVKGVTVLKPLHDIYQKG